MHGKLVLATGNQDKVLEIRTLLADLEVELVPLTAFPEVPEVVEDGATLEENAIKKAKTLSRHTGLAAVADDTGLEVAFLDGAPGVFSSRYAGEAASYADNVKKLLHELQGVPREKRGARFRCVVAFTDGETTRTVEGMCDGWICEQPRGEHGFGYDPVFYVPEYDCTFAQMSLKKKNAISHRSQAFLNFKQLVKSGEIRI